MLCSKGTIALSALLRLSDYGTGWNLDFPAFTILHVTLRLSNLHEFSFAVWWNYE